MAEWKYIQQLLDGKRFEVKHDRLWDEPRGALAERFSALHEVHGHTDSTPAAVVARHPIGKIAAYRDACAQVCEPPVGDHLHWGKECTPDEWTWDGWACQRYWNGGTQVYGDFHCLDIFDAAKFPDGYWREPFIAGAGGSHGYVLSESHWSDFRQFLDTLTFLEAHRSRPTGSLWTRHHETADCHYPAGTWATDRADSWSRVGEATSDDATGRVGRFSHGDHYGDDSFAFHPDVVTRSEIAVDLSGVWNVKHLDESACAPTRMVLYFRYRGAQAGLRKTIANCSFDVKFSGNGGASWTTVYTITVGPGATWHAAQAEWNDEALWNADFRIRIELLDDPNADTPAWGDPGPNLDAEYDATAEVEFLSLFFEFAWEYQSSLVQSAKTQAALAQPGLFQP